MPLQHRKKGGFSRTVGAHESDFFASADLQGQAVERMGFFVVIGKVEVVGLNDYIVHRNLLHIVSINSSISKQAMPAISFALGG